MPPGGFVFQAAALPVVGGGAGGQRLPGDLGPDEALAAPPRLEGAPEQGLVGVLPGAAVAPGRGNPPSSDSTQGEGARPPTGSAADDSAVRPGSSSNRSTARRRATSAKKPRTVWRIRPFRSMR